MRNQCKIWSHRVDARVLLPYVHRHCLNRWLNLKDVTHCELCESNFNLVSVHRYTFKESINLWILSNWPHLVLNLAMLLLLIGIGYKTMIVFRETEKYLLNKPYDRKYYFKKINSILCGIATSLLFIVEIIILIVCHIMSWYRLWQHSVLRRLLHPNQ